LDREATAFLQERYNQVCPEKSALRIDPLLDEGEAQLFMQGHEAGIFSIDEEGYVQTKLLAKPTRKSGKRRAIQMFWHPAPRFLFREGVCQLSTASSLILKYGWNADSIVMEPVRREFGPLAYGVDIVIRNAAGQFVCGDVKRGKKELDALLRDFRSCCGLGLHSRIVLRILALVPFAREIDLSHSSTASGARIKMPFSPRLTKRPSEFQVPDSGNPRCRRHLERSA
jgi:hypothetical protein